MNELAEKFLRSWATVDSRVNPTVELLAWIEERNRKVSVDVQKCPFDLSGFWYYDDESGMIQNRNQSFFQIIGIRQQEIESEETTEQPIILQNEIGYLGIICKEIDGVLHCLMQAKIEPGNINKIQISPTIQATKSNFTQKHGGAKPAYLDYFLKASPNQVIVDQIQSEQSSRFLKKRNRNTIILLDEDVEVLHSHRWMTIGQIKALMRVDNLVNMDTRTVLSCIPYSLWSISSPELCKHQDIFEKPEIGRTVLVAPCHNPFTEIYRCLNDRKMFSHTRQRLIPLFQLERWEMKGDVFCCKDRAPFQIVFCNIEIEGREVKKWTQPLFEAAGIATFGLILFIRDGKAYFIIKARSEIGCFDDVELGPTVQSEWIDEKNAEDWIENLFWSTLQKRPEAVRCDVMLSEEGGRFYHEQNRNIILEADEKLFSQLPPGYLAVDYYTLNLLVQVNNCLNIQLRNLLSLLEA